MAKQIYLSSADLKTTAGQELLQLCLDITADGRVDVEEIKTLRKWLLVNGGNESVPSIGYLYEIMNRILADGIVDRDELLELQMAIERAIPPKQRKPAQDARKEVMQARKERKKKKRELAAQVQRQRDEELRKLKKETQERERKKKNRIRHTFSSVRGVSFPNDDGSSRQRIISKCKVGEWLRFQHDTDNTFSDTAFQVLRQDMTQIGHVASELSENVFDWAESGLAVFGIITDLTGGTRDKPTRGVNYAIIRADKSVTDEELFPYVAANIVKPLPPK